MMERINTGYIVLIISLCIIIVLCGIVLWSQFMTKKEAAPTEEAVAEAEQEVVSSQEGMQGTMGMTTSTDLLKYNTGMGAGIADSTKNHPGFTKMGESATKYTMW